MKDDKPLKCWDCEFLGRCEKLTPCRSFRRYHYLQGRVPKREYTLAKIAELCGWAVSVLRYRLHKHEEATLAKVYKLTGLRLKLVQKGKRHYLVKLVKEEKA